MADSEASMADTAPDRVTSHYQVTYIVHHFLLNIVDNVDFLHWNLSFAYPVVSGFVAKEFCIEFFLFQA
jgi:hypothetical protein